VIPAHASAAYSALQFLSRARGILDRQTIVVARTVFRLLTSQLRGEVGLGPGTSMHMPGMTGEVRCHASRWCANFVTTY
jgi:hypothetical protein